jgi:cytochrome c-type biogenesis protein CcmE
MTGTFVMHRDLGQNLSKEKQDEIRFDYIDGNFSSRFMYDRIMPFFISQNQNSITQGHFDHGISS